MRVLIVHAHPDTASFNAALTHHAVAELTGLGHEVEVSDLYAMQFNAVAGSHDFPNGRQRNDRFRLQEEQLAAGRNLAPDIRAEQVFDACDPARLGRSGTDDGLGLWRFARHLRSRGAEG